MSSFVARKHKTKVDIRNMQEQFKQSEDSATSSVSKLEARLGFTSSQIENETRFPRQVRKSMVLHDRIYHGDADVQGATVGAIGGLFGNDAGWKGYKSYDGLFDWRFVDFRYCK